MSYQYDVFISFKNSAEHGLTEDRKVAGRFYDTFKQNDMRVFFSNSTLPDNGISNYMLEIQNALDYSRSILVVFSEAEYITGGWVAQEWMTFLNLLMNDPQRKIYIYSIKNDNSLLPPFLRPYECFGEYDSAVNHIINGTKNTDQPVRNGIIKREFLNSYWGLFGNTNIENCINKELIGKFYNYEVYCLKSRFLISGDIETYKAGLMRLIETRHNPLASYLLSRLFHDVKYLDLPRAKKLSRDAYESFLTKVNNSSEDPEISLWILTDGHEYDGAFYMCDVVHDVLDAYDVRLDIRIVSPDNIDDIQVEGQKKTVLFWSDVCVDVPDDFIGYIKQYKEKVYIVLNSFGEDALSYDLKDFEVFENNNTEITKLCRTLLS